MSIQAFDVPSEKSPPVRRAFVVAGMHRSGTSAMTRTLSLLGAALPKGLMPAVDENNETGFWEPQSIADLNDEILQTLDSEWDDVFAFRPKEYLSNFDRFYLGRAVDLLDQEYNGAEVIVLKDPRVSVLTSFWERALGGAGYSTNYIIMVRNPLEVAESLRERDGFPREKSLLLWESYMLAAERDTRELQRVFVAYDALLEDWRLVARRIEETTGSPFARDTTTAALEIDRFLKRGMRHYRASEQDLNSRVDVPENVKTLYRLLASACEGAEIDQSAFDTIRSELAKMDNLVGPLLADLRGKVQQISRELDDLGRTNAESTARIESIEHDLTSERHEHEAAKTACDRLTTEAEDRRLELDQMAARLAELATLTSTLETERDQLGLELEGKQQQVVELLARIDNAETEKVQLQAKVARLAEQESLNASLLEKLCDHERELAAKKAGSESLGAQLAIVEADLDSARHERANDERRIDELIRELGAARSVSSDLERRLSAHFHETAALTRKVIDHQRSAVREGEKAKRIRELYGAVVAQPRWWSILSRAHLSRRRDARLRRLGIFDAESYLSKNPDVAEAGEDPLHHYLHHGIDEQRPI